MPEAVKQIILATHLQTLALFVGRLLALFALGSRHSRPLYPLLAPGAVLSRLILTPIVIPILPYLGGTSVMRWLAVRSEIVCTEITHTREMTVCLYDLIRSLSLAVPCWGLLLRTASMGCVRCARPRDKMCRANALFSLIMLTIKMPLFTTRS